MDNCKACNKEFKRKYPKGGKRQIYCSKKCRYKDAPKFKCICKTCNKRFNVIHLQKNKEYCSLACIKRYPCQLCGKTITGRVTFQGKEKKFCTRTCSNFWHRTINSKLSYVAKGYAKTIKKLGQLQCEKCLIKDEQVLCVHHIDSNRKNNLEENLETLCANCHHKKHWGNSKNKERIIQLAKMLVKYS